MKKIITLTLALILALSLAACGGGLGDIVVPSGLSTPSSTNSSGNTSTGNDAVSMNALAGSWWASGKSESYAWAFSADGIFATGYTSSSRIPVAYATTGVYQYTIKGNYRVNGYIIEFYNCQMSDDFSYKMSGRYLTSEEAAKLLNTLLDKPREIDDFSIQFEFYDAMNLRIINSRTEANSYDVILPYNGNSHNVTAPTHQIPSKPWPKDLLPSDFPEYGSGGRVESVEKDNIGNVTIYIDRTTLETYVDYCNRLLQLGWSFKYSSETIEEVKGGYVVSLVKGDQMIIMNGTSGDYVYGNIRIIFYP